MQEKNRHMDAWGGPPEPDRPKPAYPPHRDKSNWAIVATLIVLTAVIFSVLPRIKALRAYERISQACGLVRVNPEDGKRYVSFAPRVHMKLGEDAELVAALDALQDIPDLRGCNLDEIHLSEADLERFGAIDTLEMLSICNSGLSASAVTEFWKRHPQIEEILTAYPEKRK